MKRQIFKLAGHIDLRQHKWQSDSGALLNVQTGIAKNRQGCGGARYQALCMSTKTRSSAHSKFEPSSETRKNFPTAGLDNPKGQVQNRTFAETSITKWEFRHQSIEDSPLKIETTTDGGREVGTDRKIAAALTPSRKTNQSSPQREACSNSKTGPILIRHL